MSLITGLAIVWVVMGVMGLGTMLIDVLAQGLFFQVWRMLWQPCFTITITHQVAKPAPIMMTAEVIWEEEEEETEIRPVPTCACGRGTVLGCDMCGGVSRQEFENDLDRWEDEMEIKYQSPETLIVPISSINVDGWDEVTPSVTQVSTKQLFHVWNEQAKIAHHNGEFFYT